MFNTYSRLALRALFSIIVYVERKDEAQTCLTHFITCSLFFPGLSNESWSIMKNMATELCIILIGYFTLVPAIQVTHTQLH